MNYDDKLTNIIINIENVSVVILFKYYDKKKLKYIDNESLIFNSNI
jgi:hypothetical protein